MQTSPFCDFFFIAEDFAKVPSTASKLRIKSTVTAVPVLFSKVPTVAVLKKYRGTAHLCLSGLLNGKSERLQPNIRPGRTTLCHTVVPWAHENFSLSGCSNARSLQLH